MIRFLVFVTVVLCSCKTTTFYIVRHAEKEAGTTMTATTTKTSDVPLSAAGRERAEALKNLLMDKKIQEIFSTNTLRTSSTAKPLSDAVGVPIQLYNAVDAAFLSRLKALDNRSVLIVGHSNTVDDLVNGLTGEKQLSDLNEDQFGDLFVVRKKGNKYNYQLQHFGK